MQTNLRHQISTLSGYPGSLHRSQERLIQSLYNLPNYWRLVPCYNKIPLGKQWQSNYFSPQVLLRSLTQEGKVWVNGRKGLYSAVPNGYSLLCGAQHRNRYLVAVDCDSEEAMTKFQRLKLPTTVCYSSGRKWRSQFLYYVDRPVKSFKLADGLEVRGDNLLSTLPPSVHPKTGGYQWIVSPDRVTIPTISSLWLEQLRIIKPKVVPVMDRIARSDSRFKTVEELVYSINPVYADIYDDWMRIGMALKDWDEGLMGLWDEWSRSSSKYKPGECAYKWQTFNRSGITFRTVYYYAKL